MKLGMMTQVVKVLEALLIKNYEEEITTEMT